MTILGTKKFWKPAQGAAITQQSNQILKNSGYINIQLHSVNYMSVGNFWQNTFGGSDKIALATNLKYESGTQSIEATSVQDVRTVKVNRNYCLGLQRNIAVKIPANSDAIAIDVRITSIKDDLLKTKFDMLNKTEYQAALQLAPTVVGQVLTITSLVKKLFSDSDPQAQLEASYAGIISSQSENYPISNGKLTNGYLIMISTNDGDQFDNVDETKFVLRGDTLYYDNSQVENTYMIFNISFDPLKGNDEKSNWFKKYNDALNNLDKIQVTTDPKEQTSIFNDSKNMWIEGNALIDADISYINSEKVKIKGIAIKSIKDKYDEIIKSQQAIPNQITAEIINGLTSSKSFETVIEAMPAIGEFITTKHDIDPSKQIDSKIISDISSNLFALIGEDSDNYLKDLKKNNIEFTLGSKTNVSRGIVGKNGNFLKRSRCLPSEVAGHQSKLKKL